MKVSIIQGIPIRKAAFVKSAPNSNNSNQNANFSMKIRPSQCQRSTTHHNFKHKKRISMAKGILSVIAIFPDKWETKSEWG
jgi:hypothetical protein